MNEVKVIILCDNINGTKTGFKQDPGFSAAIKINNKIIIFDTGMYQNNLYNNLKMAGIKAEKVDAVILSHNHNDHTDGLFAILNENPDVPVYIHKKWEKAIVFQGIDIPDKNRIIVEKPGKQPDLSENLLITNPLYSIDYNGINEQAVMIHLKNSFGLICGCCHPGLINFLEQRSILGIDQKMPFYIIGGMHGFYFTDKQALELKSKIKTIILCHCTENISVFKRQFKDNCESGILGKEYYFE